MKLAQNKKKEEVSKKAPKKEESKEQPEEEGEGGIKTPYLFAFMKSIMELTIPTHNSTLNQEMEKFYNMVMSSEKATPKQIRKQFSVVITTLNKVNAIDQGALDRKNEKGKKGEKGGKKEEKKETKKKASGDLINGLIKLAYDNPDMRADILQVLHPVEKSESVESKIIRYAYETPTVRLPLLCFLAGTLDKLKKGKIRTASDVQSEMITGVIHFAYLSRDRQDYLPLVFDLLQRERPSVIKNADVAPTTKKKRNGPGKDLAKGTVKSVKTLAGGVKKGLSGLKALTGAVGKVKEKAEEIGWKAKLKGEQAAKDVAKGVGEYAKKQVGQAKKDFGEISEDVKGGAKSFKRDVGTSLGIVRGEAEKGAKSFKRDVGTSLGIVRGEAEKGAEKVVDKGVEVVKGTAKGISDTAKGTVKGISEAVKGVGGFIKEKLKKRKEDAPERERKAKEKAEAKHKLEVAKLQAKTRAEQKKLQESNSQEGGQRVVVLRGEPPILPREFEEREPAKPELSLEEIKKALLIYLLKDLTESAKKEKKGKGKGGGEKSVKDFQKMLNSLFEGSETSSRIREEGGGDTNYGVGDTKVEEDPDLYRYLDDQEGADSPANPGESTLTPDDYKTPPDRYLYDFLERYGDNKIKNPDTDLKVSYDTLLYNRTFESARKDGYEKIWPKANKDAWTWALNEEKQRGFDFEEAQGGVAKFKAEREADLKRLKQKGEMGNWSEKKMEKEIQKHTNRTREGINKLTSESKKIRNQKAEKRDRGSWVGNAWRWMTSFKGKDTTYGGARTPPKNLGAEAKSLEEDAKRMLGSDPEFQKRLEGFGLDEDPEGLSDQEIELLMGKTAGSFPKNPQSMVETLIRKAYSNPELRPSVLPFVKGLHREGEDSSWLANSLVRIAHQNPDVRSEILSILVD